MKNVVILAMGLLNCFNLDSQVVLEPDKIIVGSVDPYTYAVKYTDTLFMFLQERGVFRAGAANRYDSRNGLTAHPDDLGLFSGAWGYGNNASGDYSTSFGRLNQATDDYAVSWGLENWAFGVGTTCWGFNNSAEGPFTTTMGYSNSAQGFATTTIGMYADPIVEIEALNFALEENPLFIIGNGTFEERSNAMVVQRDGAVGIGTSSPAATLHVDGENPSIRIGLVDIESVGNFRALSIHGDIDPSSPQLDIGRNNPDDHWDRVVANDFISYQNNTNSKSSMERTTGLESVLKMSPVVFRSTKKDGRLEKRNGIEIVSLQQVVPEAVLTHDDFYNMETGQYERKKMKNPAISYMQLIPILVKAVQDLSEIVERQNERIIELEK